MRAIFNNQWAFPGKDTWALDLRLLNQTTFACSASSGQISIFTIGKEEPIFSFQAHKTSINSILVIDENTIVSCSEDGVKVWDLRTSCKEPKFTLTNQKNSNFISLGSNGKILAAGTELQGVDAELHLWDIQSGELIRSFVDSHHDDITDIKFHPTLSQYLMSGSTDGCVNIYDLNESEEEDALHQVINFASIHSCHFIQERRIAVLSHMETIAFFELNSTNYETIEEPQPHNLGDVRQAWPDCEYVIDLFPGFVAFGANSQSKLSVYPFDLTLEQIDLNKPIWFPVAHGEEVTRSILYIPGTRTMITAGEDGTVKSWEIPYTLENTQPFYANVDNVKDEEMESDNEVIGVAEKSVKKDKKDKTDKKEKKDKKDKKDKKERKDKKDKKKHKKDENDDKKSDSGVKKSKKKKDRKDVLFKPY